MDMLSHHCMGVIVFPPLVEGPCALTHVWGPNLFKVLWCCVCLPCYTCPPRYGCLQCVVCPPCRACSPCLMHLSCLLCLPYRVCLLCYACLLCHMHPTCRTRLLPYTCLHTGHVVYTFCTAWACYPSHLSRGKSMCLSCTCGPTLAWVLCHAQRLYHPLLLCCVCLPYHMCLLCQHVALAYLVVCTYLAACSYLATHVGFVVSIPCPMWGSFVITSSVTPCHWPPTRASLLLWEVMTHITLGGLPWGELLLIIVHARAYW